VVSVKVINLLDEKVQEINRRIVVLQITLNDLIRSISEYVDEANKEITRLRNEAKKVVENESQEGCVEQRS